MEECKLPRVPAPPPHAWGISQGRIFVHSCDMSKKLSPPPAISVDSAKELEHLYAQLAAVEALIRALEVYRQYYPSVVPPRRKTA